MDILQRICDSKYKTVRLFLPKGEQKGKDKGIGMARDWDYSLPREVVKLPSLEMF